ncbi:hypothetical protein SUDANB105_06292 [Streptomyces sp. enrichment culture]
MREIASRIPVPWEPPGAIVWTGRLAGIFRWSGIFGECRSSFMAGNGGGIGHRSRNPHPGGVKQRKPGSHWGVGVFGPASGLLAVGSDTVMGTAERREAPARGTAAHVTAERGTKVPDRDVPVGTRADTTADEGAVRAVSTVVAPRSWEPDDARERPQYRPLWVEEPAKRRRLPDPVRTAAVRAVLIIAVTLIQAMVAFLSTLAGSWLAFPMVLSSVASTVVATWGVLDVWVTRQVWSQRNGVVSAPSSTARTLRRERRRMRRQARAAERTQERIRRTGGAEQLSHS